VGELKFEGSATVRDATRKVAKIAALADEDRYIIIIIVVVVICEFDNLHNSTKPA
jgi:hypothetical protein